MVNISKLLLVMLTAMFAIVASVFASPVSVTSVDVQDVNGNYIVLVSLNNANVASGKYSELSFTIEELGTTKNVGVVKVDTNGSTVVQYNLREITDSFSLLKEGSTYQVKVTTDGNTMTKAFLFGSERDTDGLGLVLDSVKVNSEDLTGIDTLQVMNGETLKIDLRLSALEDFDNARLMAFVEGYEHSTLVSSTEVFSVKTGKTYVKTLSITLPNDMNAEKDYKLRLVGANDLSGLTYKDYTLYVDTQRDRVDILDLVMTPSSGVEPGQNLIANVRMKNRGQQSQDSVKVSVEIEALGVKESSYLSNINPGEVATSDDMLLYIPEDALAKQYEVTVVLTYNDGHTDSSSEYTLNVISPKSGVDKSLLVSFKNNVDLKSNEATSFDIVIANPNDASKPISIASQDNAWADVEISPSLAMVKAGESATFKVTVTPKAAISGEKELTLVVKEGAKSISEVTVSTYVEPSSNVNWVNVALALLLIIAIIILLALVISIAKRRNDKDEENSSTEEYY